MRQNQPINLEIGCLVHVPANVWFYDKHPMEASRRFNLKMPILGIVLALCDNCVEILSMNGIGGKYFVSSSDIYVKDV